MMIVEVCSLSTASQGPLNGISRTTQHHLNDHVTTSQWPLNGISNTAQRVSQGPRNDISRTTQRHIKDYSSASQCVSQGLLNCISRTIQRYIKDHSMCISRTTQCVSQRLLNGISMTTQRYIKDHSTISQGPRNGLIDLHVLMDTNYFLHPECRYVCEISDHRVLNERQSEFVERSRWRPLRDNWVIKFQSRSLSAQWTPMKLQDLMIAMTVGHTFQFYRTSHEPTTSAQRSLTLQSFEISSRDLDIFGYFYFRSMAAQRYPCVMGPLIHTGVSHLRYHMLRYLPTHVYHLHVVCQTIEYIHSYFPKSNYTSTYCMSIQYFFFDTSKNEYTAFIYTE